MVRKLLWVDCVAAALAGVAVLALSGWLSRLHELPRELIVFVGAVNLLFVSDAFTLARRAERPLSWIRLLVAGNATWTGACLALAAAYRTRASVYRIVHLSVRRPSSVARRRRSGASGSGGRGG
jgi:hypothetical protein